MTQTTNDPKPFSNDTPNQWSWLCGLADGEGCFTISIAGGVFHCNFAITLRMDDWDTLLLARNFTGLGVLRVSLAPKKRKEWKPTATWGVSTVDESLSLLAGFESGGGLRSKKARDLATWSTAVTLLDRYGGGIHSEAREQLTALKEKLQEDRKYKELAPAHYQDSVGRVGGRIGRSSKSFWKSDEAQSHRQWRQLRYSKLNQEQIDDIVKRIDAGETRTNLAREHDVSISTISKFYSGKYLRRDGTLIPVVGTPGLTAASKGFWESDLGKMRRKQMVADRCLIKPERYPELVADSESGMTQSQMAEKYGVSRPTIRKTLGKATATLE